MPELDFTVEAVDVLAHAVTPSLAFKLRLDSHTGQSIHSVMLRCQIQLEVSRRSYTAMEQARLRDLFGQPDMWGRTLHSLLWTNTSVIVPAFSGSAQIQLPVACTFDFNVAATKYFAGLEAGEVPLCLLFSGTIFYSGAAGALQVCQIPWEKEASYRLPIAVWRGLMEHYYPEGAWLCLRRDVFDRLFGYKARHGLPTWEEAIASLLDSDGDTRVATRKEAGRQ